MAHEGHGNHWQGLVGERVTDRWLPIMVERGRLIDPRTDGSSPNSTTLGIAWPDTPLGGLALISRKTAETNFVLVSGYPFAVKGVRHRLLIEQIFPWQNGIEAWIKASLPGGDGPDLTFFDTRFYANRRRLHIGSEAEFILAGLAYTAEVIHPEPVLITNPETIRVMRAKTDQPDSLDPIEVSMEGAAVLLPKDAYAPDEYQFQGPVKMVEAFDAFDMRIIKLRLTVARLRDTDATDIDIDLYVSDHVWRTGERPLSGSDVRGLFWLQGHLAA